MRTVNLGLEVHNLDLSASSRVRWEQLQDIVNGAFPGAKVRERQIIDWEMVDTEEDWDAIGIHYRVEGGGKAVRVTSTVERRKGRSENYWDKSAEGQWAEDKRLGILDWDGN